MIIGDKVKLTNRRFYGVVPENKIGVIVDIIRIGWLDPVLRFVVFWGEDIGHTQHPESDLTKV